MEYKHWGSVLAGLSYNGTSMLFNSSLSHSLIHSRRCVWWYYCCCCCYYSCVGYQQYFTAHGWDGMKELFFLLVPFLNTRVINCSGFLRIFFHVDSVRIAHNPEESEKRFFFSLFWRRRGLVLNHDFSHIKNYYLHITSSCFVASLEM